MVSKKKLTETERFALARAFTDVNRLSNYLEMIGRENTLEHLSPKMKIHMDVTIASIQNVKSVLFPEPVIEGEPTLSQDEAFCLIFDAVTLMAQQKDEEAYLSPFSEWREKWLKEAGAWLQGIKNKGATIHSQ